MNAVARRILELALPCSMGGFGHEYRKAEFLGEDVQAGYVIRVLMGDEYTRERLRIDTLGGEAAAGFAAGKSAIDEHAGLRRCDDRAVARAAGGQDCDGNRHKLQDSWICGGRRGDARIKCFASKGFERSGCRSFGLHKCGFGNSIAQPFTDD